MRYSPSTGGFYPESITYPNLPTDLVEIDDATHAALLAGEAAGKRIVAGASGVPVLEDAPVNLIAYANRKQWALATGGYTVNIGGQQLLFPTDDVGRGLIDGKVSRLGQANPPNTVNWQFTAGPTLGSVAILPAKFIAAAIEIADFVQATFDALPGIEAGIAGGAMTTTAEVDTALAAVSNVSTTQL